MTNVPRKNNGKPPKTPGEKREAGPQVEMNQITDQAAFMSALGIDPNTVVQNSALIQFSQDGQLAITYQAIRVVTPQQLSMAFFAGGAQPQPTEEP